MKTSNTLILAFLLSGLLACQSNQKTPDAFEKAQNLHEKIYAPMVKRSSQYMASFNGLDNQFELKATLLSTDLLKKQLELQSLYSQWTPRQLNKEMKAIDENNTKVFVSFFSNLDKAGDPTSKKSPWTFTLEVDGQKYSGKIKENRSSPHDLKRLYPFHTRWSTAFDISFPVPIQMAQRKGAKLTVSSAISARSVVF